MRWEEEKRDELGERKGWFSEVKTFVRVVVKRNRTGARVSDPYNQKACNGWQKLMFLAVKMGYSLD